MTGSIPAKLHEPIVLAVVGSRAADCQSTATLTVNTYFDLCTMDNSNDDPNQYAGEETDIPVKQDPEERYNDRDDVVGSAAIRPVFLWNLRAEYSSDKIEELFTRPIPPPGATEETYRPIPVDRIDVKRGFCFVFLKDAASQQDKEQVESFVSAINGM
jgi:hypothetical protein